MNSPSKKMKKSNNQLNFDQDKSAWVNERYLPKGEFDINIEDISRNGYTIIKNKFHDTALYLIACGVDCTVSNKEKSNILHLATSNGLNGLIPIIYLKFVRVIW